MRLRKRGSEESFSFLIGILIMIMILTPIIIIAYRAFAEKQGVEKCFTEIVDISAKLKDGEEKEILCRFQKDYVLMGFDAKQDVIETPFTDASSIISSPKQLAYAKPQTCSSGSTDEGIIKDDMGCLCFCSDPGQPISYGRKCSGKTKCAQFKEIRTISGLQLWNKDGYRDTAGKYWSMTLKGGYKLIKGVGEEEVKARVSSGKITASPTVIVFGHDQVLGILIKRSGEELKICVPGYDCDYRKKFPGYQFALGIESCRAESNDNCLCNEIEYEILPNSDFVIAVDKQTNVNRIGNYYPNRPEGRQYEWITDFSGKLCTYDGRLSEKKKYIDRFSLLELYPESQGYTMGKKKVQPIKVGTDVCFLTYADVESLKLPSCYVKPVVQPVQPPQPASPLQSPSPGTVSLR